MQTHTDKRQSFDQSFAELVSNILYKHVEQRSDICKALQALVETNEAVLALEGPEDDLVLQRRISKAEARRNLDHLAAFGRNLLAVLFNVYSETLPQFRGFMLKCINTYLRITPVPVRSPRDQGMRRF